MKIRARLASLSPTDRAVYMMTIYIRVICVVATVWLTTLIACNVMASRSRSCECAAERSSTDAR